VDLGRFELPTPWLQTQTTMRAGMSMNEHPTNIHAGSVHIRVSLLGRACHVTFVHTSTVMSQNTSQN
jgi:hypothetical protein